MWSRESFASCTGLSRSGCGCRAAEAGHRGQRKATRGVTLAEIMLALVFTSLAVLAVLGVSTYAAKAKTASDERQRASILATTLAWRCVESLAEDFDREDLAVDYPPGQLAGAELDPEERYRYGIALEAVGVPPGSLDDLKRLTVTVGWESSRGAQTYVLTTKVAR